MVALSGCTGAPALVGSEDGIGGVRVEAKVDIVAAQRHPTCWGVACEVQRLRCHAYCAPGLTRFEPEEGAHGRTVWATAGRLEGWAPRVAGKRDRLALLLLLLLLRGSAVTCCERRQQRKHNGGHHCAVAALLALAAALEV
jgi:hypothetical protein